MRTAKHAKTHRDDSRPNGSSLRQATYRLNPPLDLAPYHLQGQATHVLISTSVDPRIKVEETLVVPTTSPDHGRATAEVLRLPPTSDAAALERLGYAIA